MSRADETNLLGIGLYTAREASRFLKIPSSTFKRWEIRRFATLHKPPLVAGIPQLGAIKRHR